MWPPCQRWKLRWDLSSRPTQKSTVSAFKLLFSVVSRSKISLDFGAASLSIGSGERIIWLHIGRGALTNGQMRCFCCWDILRYFEIFWDIWLHSEEKLTFHFQPSWRRLHLHRSNQQGQTPLWGKDFLLLRCKTCKISLIFYSTDTKLLKSHWCSVTLLYRYFFTSDIKLLWSHWYSVTWSRDSLPLSNHPRIPAGLKCFDQNKT